MTTEAAFSRIVVPIDFSAGSEKAWSLAQRLARCAGARLTLLHVLRATPLDLSERTEREERRAELRALQAEHQLGIPRADSDDAEPPPPTVFEGPFVGEVVKGFSDAGRAWAERLENWADTGRAAGCAVRTVLRVGTPYHEVVAEASAWGADLVLLATHGRGEVHRLLVGSVADRVIRLARCPVLTVKEA